MPRYFFNVLNDVAEPDLDGFEFPDDHAARVAAVRLSGELISEMDAKFWNSPSWRMQVTSQDQRLLLTLTFSAEEHESHMPG